MNVFFQYMSYLRNEINDNDTVAKINKCEVMYHRVSLSKTKYGGISRARV